MTGRRHRAVAGANIAARLLELRVVLALVHGPHTWQRPTMTAPVEKARVRYVRIGEVSWKPGLCQPVERNVIGHLNGASRGEEPRAAVDPTTRL